MKRPLTIIGFLALGLLLLVISFLARSNRTSRENMVGDRGQVAEPGPQNMFHRTRAGLRQSSASARWTGVLVDAGCPNRDSFALLSPPAATVAQEETPAPGAASPGVSVSPTVLANERADAEAQQVPDLRARNSDPACAVTALTRAFALFLPDGELKNLDEGGNTKAAIAFQGTARGQAVLNGRLLGDKPRAVVTGVVEGDGIVVDEIELR